MDSLSSGTNDSKGLEWKKLKVQRGEASKIRVKRSKVTSGVKVGIRIKIWVKRGFPILMLKQNRALAASASSKFKVEMDFIRMKSLATSITSMSMLGEGLLIKPD